MSVRAAMLISLITVGALPAVALAGEASAPLKTTAELPPSATPRVPYRVSDGFRAFQKDVERMNHKRTQSGEFAWFQRVDEIGIGAVQLVAHDAWVNAPLEDRQSSLQIMVNLWSVRTGLDEGIKLVITDNRGIPLMHGTR